MSAARVVAVLLASTALISISACSDESATAPPASPSLSVATRDALVAEVRALTAARGIGPLAKPAPVRPALVRLGRALAFDKLLSGNRDISCMTCHLPEFATGDGRSLSIGQGASGSGTARVHPLGKFIPRNAPPTFNLFTETSLFWDGRVEIDAPGHLATPAGAELTPAIKRSFEFGALSGAAVVPRAVPRGNARRQWERVGRVQGRTDAPHLEGPDDPARAGEAVPAAIRGGVSGHRFEQMNFGYASNAIAGFLIDQFAFNNSPWDRFLDGRDYALTKCSCGEPRTS